MPANYKCISAPSISSAARGIWTVQGMAILLFAGCAADETPAAGKRLPGIIVDEVSTHGKLQQVDYRDAKNGERYRLQASLGADGAGWIEARPMKDTADSVRIEFTPKTVQVTANNADGSAQFWVAGRERGLDQINVRNLKQHHDGLALDYLPFLVQSAAQADALLDSTRLSTTMAVAQDLLSVAPPKTQVMAAETFTCDTTIPIDDNCGVEAKMVKANKEVFAVPSGWWQDKNTMDLKCGDADGLVRIQACPLDAYNCDKYKTAKTEQALTVGDVSDDTSNKNSACVILKSEGEGVDVGKKFEVKGLAEIRPGRAVRPKDPGDEAKSPEGCKLVWDLPEAPDWIYHSQWADGHDTEKSHNKKFEVGLTAGAASGSLAIGGKSEIKANVHTCQDSDTGRDDYAFYIRGSRSNALYTCSN
jgi:hypothetical protein